jgi:hypothetical protein
MKSVEQIRSGVAPSQAGWHSGTGSTGASQRASLSPSAAKALAALLVLAAEWLAPGRFQPSVKAAIIAVAASGIGMLYPLVGAGPVGVLIAAWILVCYLLRRGTGSLPAVASREGSVSPMESQDRPAPAPTTGKMPVAFSDQSNITGKMLVPLTRARGSARQSGDGSDVGGVPTPRFAGFPWPRS